jgi:hypothetical protein
MHSNTEFEDFNACVDDARAHGYHHVEVPVLHWSCAHDEPLPQAQPLQVVALPPVHAPVCTLEETQ